MFKLVYTCGVLLSQSGLARSISTKPPIMSIVFQTQTYSPNLKTPTGHQSHLQTHLMQMVLTAVVYPFRIPT
jgi:hypothetical protein